MLQDHLLYYPEQATLAEIAARFPDLRPWPAAEGLRGYVREPASPARATVLVFHGNAGHAAQRQWYAEELQALGLRVILAEYPGYGPRPGKLGESALVADASETLRRAHQQFGTPLVVIGESLGAAVAAAAVQSAPRTVSGLLLITPWDKLESVAKLHYPWLPVSLFLHDRYDSAARLCDFAGPTLVMVAAADSIVPAALGRKLYDLLPGEKRFLSVAGAEHNDWAVRIDESWWPTTVGYLLKN